MVAIFSGENLTGILGLLPGSDTLPAKRGAVVRAAGVDGVHVVHQHLAVSAHLAVVNVRPIVLIALSWVTALADCITGIACKVVLTSLCREDPAGIMVLLPGSSAHPSNLGAVAGAGWVVLCHVMHKHLTIGADNVMVQIRPPALVTLFNGPRRACGCDCGQGWQRVHFVIPCILVDNSAISTNKADSQFCF